MVRVKFQGVCFRERVSIVKAFEGDIEDYFNRHSDLTKELQKYLKEFLEDNGMTKGYYSLEL